VARQAAEKRVEEIHAELEAKLQRASAEVNRLHGEAEKTQLVFEKLHSQIQAGREDRQMITLEMERIRSGFDAEREAKEEVIVEMRKLREERDANKREVENMREQLICERKLVKETTAALSQEREEKECVTKELEKLKEEFETANTLPVSASVGLQTHDMPEQHQLQADESHEVERSASVRIRSPEAKADMERFQAEMNTRREIRQRVLHAVSSEMERLRTELNSERETRKQLEQTLLHTGSNKKSEQQSETLTLELGKAQEKMKVDKKRLKQLNQENERLQSDLENGRQILAERTEDLEKLQAQLEAEREHFQKQIVALKEVAAISKQMLMIREGQVMQLKEKLKEIEASVTNRVHEKLTEDLKTEYESQMENIRSLKGLYEERLKVMLSEKEKLVQDSEEKTQHLEAEIRKSAEFEQQLAELKMSLSQKEEENSNLQIQLDDSQDKSQGLAKELSHINNLFTQMLVGSTATDMDLDKLTRLLQENHDLITEITIKEDCSEAAATLPKLLLDIVTQVDSGTASMSSSPTGDRVEDNQADLETQTSPFVHELTAENIVGVNSKSSPEECTNGMAVQDIALNLPKVWKVLMELLSHHVPPSYVGDCEDSKNSCYKSIDTPSGPRLVISVSKTFLRLKDLILEKKSLQKELTRLKQLNGHLESKLNDQEHKLSLVSSELRKTWNVVDRMQTQHQQLHTHEKILRYELHEKRKMLTELKQELEYCREKWERARQKSSESEVEWRKLRKEFASRKKQPLNLLNNSGESGFSDERGDDSCEDDDATSKDTGQLDPRTEELPNLHAHPRVICTSSPLDPSFPQPHILLPSSGVCEANSLGSSLGQTELLLHEPIFSETNIMPGSASEHAGLLNHSEPELMLDLEAESLPNSVSESSGHQDTYHAELQSHSSSMCFDSLQRNIKQEDVSDCRMDPPVHHDCSTISLITLLKQQLSFFSRNLDYITAGTDDVLGHNLQALESIFSLPPIQIPKSLNDNITKQDCFQSFYCCEQEECHFSSSPPPSSSSVPMTPDLSSDKINDSVCSVFKSDHGIMSGETETVEENCTQNYTLSDNITSKETDYTTKYLADESTTLQEPDAENNTCNQQNSCNDSRSSEELGAVQYSQEHLKASRTPEEVAEARAARLKRLEEQCQQLYNKVTRTTHRSTALCNRLEELHEQYRSSDSPLGAVTDSESNIPAPPPFPHVLHARQIPTTPVLTQRNNSEELQASTSTTSSPSFLHTLYSRQIPVGMEQVEVNDSRDITETDSIPTPPPFPHNLHPTQIRTSSESTVTQVSDAEEGSGRIFIPTPPPLPHSLRGRLLPLCSVQSQSNNSESLDSRMQTTNETTTQRIPSTIQMQEEPATSSSSTRHTNPNVK
jgi:chromosome segregation ATPase